MANGYATVKVSVVGSSVVCDPDPFLCYWDAGPPNARWTFADVPANVASVIIEWKKDGPPYKGKPMFRGHGAAPSSVGARLPDVVTFGNIKEAGWYRYSVICLDASGNVVAEADPTGGTSDQPPPPPGP